MRLLHLTSVGPHVAPATVEFAPRTTVIYGASQSGKTYILDALNYMMGASTLRELPEARPFQTMLLGVEFDDGSVTTLARDLRGGRFRVYDEDLREFPSRPPDRSLRAQHDRVNKDNISSYLLDQLGVADARLRKNQRNQVNAMSFRNMAHLVLIDEVQMQERHSPVETGIPQTRTVEWSAFKLLVEGVDDSDLPQGEDPTAFRRVNRGQIEVLDRAIALARTRLDGAPERPACLESLARVNAAIMEVSETVDQRVVARDALLLQRASLGMERQREVARVSESETVFHRFNLLDQQYSSDLRRLDLVKEAGTLLGYFDAETCVFCGAPEEHQRRDHAVYETVQLAEAIDAEVEKVEALRADLALTLTSVQDVVREARNEVVRIEGDLKAVDVELAALDGSLSPEREHLHELIARRSQLEGWLSLWSQVDELDGLRSVVERETPSSVDPVGHGVTQGSVGEFSALLRSVLERWQVPGASTSQFSFQGRPRISIGGREREDCGKGMRSVLHAAFSLSLSRFCIERELPHPGFVVLDSPVLTYRGAVDAVADEVDDELLSESVSSAFYRYLADKQPGQVIVLENQTPPAFTAPGCSVLLFSGSPKTGRSGFYPALGGD